MALPRLQSQGISIHALREEGDSEGINFFETLRISIHALREEGDRSPGHTPGRHLISIHALREEGDPCTSRPFPVHQHFYPRPP